MEKAKTVLIEMFEQRNYNTIEEGEEENQVIAIKPDGNQICAFFDVLKFNSEKAQEIIKSMNSLGVNHSIVVYKDSVTSAAKNINQNLENMEIELFSEEQLQYNITKHRLQPKFEVLSEEEAKDFKLKYGTKFGTILRTDPVARFLYYQRGDVIKITRKDGYIDYKIVRG